MKFAAQSVHMYERNPGPYHSCRGQYKTYCESEAKMQGKITTEEGVCEECMKAAGPANILNLNAASASIRMEEMLNDIAGADNHADELTDLQAETESYTCMGGWGLM